MSSHAQCTRDPRCMKANKHIGWCRTRPEKVESNPFAIRKPTSEPLSKKRASTARGGGGLARREAMAALARKREIRLRKARGEAVEDDDEEYEEEGEGEEESGGEGESEEEALEEDEDSGDVQYSDHGMLKSERRVMREKSGRGICEGEGEWEPEEEEGHEDAPSEELESIRLKRQILEKWLIEPFFRETIQGCLVRIGIMVRDGTQEHLLYRVAEILDEKDFPDYPYAFGNRKTSKHLLLEFGEAQKWYEMSSISNQPFDQTELWNWFQVREVCGLPQLSMRHLRSKQHAIERASNFEYTEADVSRKVREEQKQASAAGKAPVLTTRQMLMAKAGFCASTAPSDLVARPLKMERNVLGQVIRSQRDEGE